MPIKEEKVSQWKLRCATLGPQSTFLSKQLHLQIFIAVSHWSRSGSLASAALSILDPHWTPLR